MNGLTAVLRDARVALRSLGKRPGFTAIAIVTLGLGIGANTAIFSVVHAFLFRDLPYPGADRLVVVWSTDRDRGETETRVSYPDYEDWRDGTAAFEGLAAFFAFPNGDVNLTGGADPERVPVARVTPGYFETLGVPLLHGRGFRPEETVAGDHRVVVLSHGLWQRQFGGDADVVGQTVDVNGFPYAIVGILPPAFRSLGALALGEAVDLWRPIVPDDNQTGGRGNRSLRVVGRLAAGISAERAEADLQAVAARLEAAYPGTNRARGVAVVALRDQVAGDVRPALIALLGSVALVLLIACANVANLLLARVAGRRREVAIRLSLGAGRWQVVRQLLTESVVLGLLGGGLGVLLAWAGTRVLRAFGPADLPLLSDVGVDAAVLTFALVVAASTGLLFGLLPALRVSRPDIGASLKEGGRSAAERGSRRMPNVLIVSELAVTLVLLVSAGLLLTGFRQLTSVDPGFDGDGVLTFQLELPMGTRYTEQSQRSVFFRTLLDRLEEQPGVASASMVSAPPMGEGDFSTAIGIVGANAVDSEPEAKIQVVEASYFETLGIPLTGGRAFTDGDGRDSPGVAIVNEAAARHWPEGRPLGGLVELGFGDPRRIVGIARNVRTEGLEAEAPPTIYLPSEQWGYNFMTVLMRSDGRPPGALVGTARAEVARLDPDQPLHNIRTMDELVSRSVAERRFQLALLATFSALAVALAIVGVYGVVSYTVSRRRAEIGVRMALGADEHSILVEVTGESVKLALIGVAIGLPAAFAATRLLRGGLFGVGALDPTAYLAAAFLLVLAVVAASLAPAWRAASVHPAEALRAD